MYTLIAFKPEKQFYDRGDWELLPAKIIREDNLSTKECIQKIVELSTETPIVSYSHGEEPDNEFEEFHVIPIEITEDVEDNIWNIKEDANLKIRQIREEKQKESEVRRKNYLEEKSIKEKEERRIKFLELEKEFAKHT